MTQVAQRRFLDIPSLDGLRAGSIAIVFLAHAGFSFVPGGFGVSFFFVISGFLITTLLCAELDRYGEISLREFYIRRAFRILPIFYVVLFIALLAAAVGILRSGVDLDATLSQLLHYFNFYAIFHTGYDIVPGTGVYWSLAIEEHFYVVFPLLFVAMNRRRWSRQRQGWALVFLCGVVLAWRIVLVYGWDVNELRTYFGSDTRADGLLFGCAAALIANPAFAQQRDRLGRPVVPMANIATAAVAGGVIMATFLIDDVGFRETVRYTIQSVAVVAVLRYAMVSVGSPAFRILNAGPIAWFGRMSYGFYLVHQVVIAGLQERISGRMTITIISLVVSTLLAWGLHVVVERPSVRLRNRVLARQSVVERASR